MTKWIVTRQVGSGIKKTEYLTRRGYWTEDKSQAHTFAYKKDALFHARSLAPKTYMLEKF